MTEIVDESRRSILRKEFYMDGLNCDPMSFDKECEQKNHLTQKELSMASKTKTNNIWCLHPQAPVESITPVLDIKILHRRY